ncbi:5'-nucleotidase C-terminal domain-containing protein [Balneolaceae bacterium ANBcel3]|nr:5'-nucleotidase C-terminal domain-containing protein [Balneolaceae bacterium ANBcel3]
MSKKGFFFYTAFFFLFLVSCNEENYTKEDGSPVSVDTVRIEVMLTADVHGRVRGWDYYQNLEDPYHSLAKIATLADSIRKSNPNTILLDAGDWLQGNLFAEYFAVHDQKQSHYPFLKAVDHMSYDAIVIGNHEFNFGIEYLNRQLEATNTPALGANILTYGTEEPAYTPYLVKEIEGIHVAIIGLTTPGSAIWDKHHVNQRLTFADGPSVAEQYTRLLQEKDLADVVIILAHSGLNGSSGYQSDTLGEENFGRTIAETIPGVHLLALGHTHRVLDNQHIDGPDGASVAVLQPGRWASHLGIAEFKIIKGKDINPSVVEVSTYNIPVTESTEEHPGVVSITEEAHQRVVSFATEPLAYTVDHWSAAHSRHGNSAIIDLIHEVQLRETGAQLSAAASFNTNVQFGPGKITRGDIGLLYPFHNTLFKIEITGEDLKKYLEFTSRYYETMSEEEQEPRINRDWPGFNFDMISGIEYHMDLRNHPGNRIVQLTYKGKEIKDEDVFTLAINSYRASGGGGFDMLSNASVLKTIYRSVSDMIISYLQKRESISKADVAQNNWKLIY